VSQLISSACDVKLRVQWHRPSPKTGVRGPLSHGCRTHRKPGKRGYRGLSHTAAARTENLENGGTGTSLTRLARTENLENGGTGASLTRLPHALETYG